MAINRASIPREIKMAKEKNKDNKWIQKAINPENKGDLREKAGVEKGENIPVRWLRKMAAQSKDKKTQKQAQFALNVKNLKKDKNKKGRA